MVPIFKKAKKPASGISANGGLHAILLLLPLPGYKQERRRSWTWTKLWISGPSRQDFLVSALFQFQRSWRSTHKSLNILIVSVCAGQETFAMHFLITFQHTTLFRGPGTPSVQRCDLTTGSEGSYYGQIMKFHISFVMCTLGDLYFKFKKN